MTDSVDFGDNLSDTHAATPELPQATGKERKPSFKRTPRAAAPAAPVDPITEEKVRIVLEDNDQIPPGGQFIGVNGRSFLLQAGQEVDVPLCVVDVLDHAITSVPVVDEMKSVIGYKDRLRFPYRVITSRRRG